jgi:polyhydroxyalkanoate synthase
MMRRGLHAMGLHMAASAAMWQAGIAAAPLACLGLAPWHGKFAARGAALAGELAAASPERLAAALIRESAARLENFVKGVELYQNHPYRRPPEARPVVWQSGTTRLLGPLIASPKAVLVVPSLINRWHILDLIPGQGFLSRLEETGIAPYVVDWGDPGPEETSFTTADYVVNRLEPAFDHVSARHEGTGILGYCLGGVLGLALTQLKAERVSCVMLVATPWDFARGRGMMARIASAAPFADALSRALGGTGSVPADLVGQWLAMVEPGGVQAKFRRFAALDQTGAEARNFVAVEDWANDGIALSNPAAFEIFHAWPAQNLPMTGGFLVGGAPVRPEAVSLPGLIVLAKRDRLVPVASSRPLAARLGNAHLIEVDTGHIGMFVGRAAADGVIAPAADWLSAHLARSRTRRPQSHRRSETGRKISGGGRKRRTS